MTSEEIWHAAAALFGARTALHARALGEIANAAIFSPATPVTGADAAAAWSQHWLLRNEVHRALGLRGRLQAASRYHRLNERVHINGPLSWSDVVRPARRRRRRHTTAPLRRH